MKLEPSPKPIAYSLKPWMIRYGLFAISYLLLAFFMFGCIRVAGTAGYSHIQDDEVVTKSTGFDLDSARLVPKNAVGS